MVRFVTSVSWILAAEMAAPGWAAGHESWILAAEMAAAGWAAGHELILFLPKNALFHHNRFSTHFFSMKMA